MRTEKPLPPMPRSPARQREIWVGLFVVGGVIAAWFALATLTEPALFRGRYIVTTTVPNAVGIRKGDAVQMRGVNIGRVIGFGIQEHGVQLRLEIEGEYPIPTDSRVELRASGLLAGMVAEVIPGQSPLRATGGDVLAGANGVGIFDKVNNLAGEADKVTNRLQKLLSDETIANLHDSGGGMNTLLRQLTSVVSEQRGELKALSASLRKSAEGVERVTTGPELEQSVRQVAELSQHVDALVARMDRSAQSLDAILARVERGEGSLGKLSKDAALYDNISQAATDFDKAAVELQQLVGDIRRQPKKYISLRIF